MHILNVTVRDGIVSVSGLRRSAEVLSSRLAGRCGWHGMLRLYG